MLASLRNAGLTNVALASALAQTTEKKKVRALGRIFRRKQLQGTKNTELETAEPLVESLLYARRSPDWQQTVRELHGTRNDCVSKGWLPAIAATFLKRNSWSFSQSTASAFATTSTCCIAGCRNKVEVGAHVTADGGSLWVIPTCSVHSRAGALDRLGLASRLKRNTVYLSLSLPGEERMKERSGKYWHDVADIPPQEILDTSIIVDTLEDNEGKE